MGVKPVDFKRARDAAAVEREAQQAKFLALVRSLPTSELLRMAGEENYSSWEPHLIRQAIDERIPIPPPKEQPVKNTTINNLHCGEPKCADVISLQIETIHTSFGQTGGHLQHALELAAASIGWRRVVSETTENRVRCPFHAQGATCARCGFAECSCVGGPRFEVTR